jgi:hypothetical protein
VLVDRRYRSLTYFCLIAGVINQCTGINAINIYSSTILSNIPQIPLNIGVYMLATANVVGAIIGPFINKCFAIRPMIIVGQFVMFTFLGLIVMFQLIDVPIGVLVSMTLMIVSYQSTLGSYYFVYINQVSNETQNSVAVAALWGMVLFFSLVTSPLITGIGIVGTFALFAAITFVGGFYFLVYMRSTQGLSSEACKVLFYPDDLKPNTGLDEPLIKD